MKVKRIILKTLAPVGKGVTDQVVDLGPNVLGMELLEGAGVKVQLKDGECPIVPLSNIAVLIPERETTEQTGRALEEDVHELGLRKGKR